MNINSIYMKCKLWLKKFPGRPADVTCHSYEQTLILPGINLYLITI